MARNSQLPTVVSNIPRDLRAFVDRVRDLLGGDTYVTRVEYLRGGNGSGGGGSGGGGGGGGGGDNPWALPCGTPVTPTAPTGLRAEGVFHAIDLAWDAPDYCGHGYTEVWGGTGESRDTATLLGGSIGSTYYHAIPEADSRWCFWIRHVNLAGQVGPFNQEAGVCAKTLIDIDYVLSLLSGQIKESHLYQSLGETIQRIDGAASVSGSVDARIAELARQLNLDLNRLANGLTDIYIQGDNGYTTLRTLRTTTDGALASIDEINAVEIDEETGSASAQAVQRLRARVNTGYCSNSDYTTQADCEANGGTWTEQDISAYVADQQEAWVNGDGALAQALEGVEAKIEARPNLCPNGNLELGLTPLAGAVTGFGLSSPSNLWGRAAVNPNVSGTGSVDFPPFVAAPGVTYAVTGDALLFQTSEPWGEVYFDLLFWDDATGALLLDGAQSPKGGTFDFVEGADRRNEFAAESTVPAAYCLLGGVNSGHADQAACQAAGGTWTTPAVARGYARFVYQDLPSGSVTGFRRVQVVRGGLLADGSMPPFSLESAAAAVTELDTARIGYCRIKTGYTGAGRTTEHKNKAECEADGSREWMQGLPWATAVKQVSATHNGQTVTVEQQFEAIYKDGGLLGQYTVKIDNKGLVSGFGLASEPTVGGGSTSSFGVRADKFWVANPATDEDVVDPPTDQLPFIIVNGDTFIKNAFIQDAAITNAKIENAAVSMLKVAGGSVTTFHKNVWTTGGSTKWLTPGSGVYTFSGAYDVDLGDTNNSGTVLTVLIPVVTSSAAIGTARVWVERNAAVMTSVALEFAVISGSTIPCIAIGYDPCMTGGQKIRTPSYEVKIQCPSYSAGGIGFNQAHLTVVGGKR